MESSQFTDRRSAPKASPQRWWALGFSLLGMASGYWSALTETPAFAAPIGIVLPPLMLAIVACAPDRFTLEPLEKWEPRGPLLLAVVFAMLGLAFGAWREFRGLVLDQAVAWFAAAALVVGAGFTLIAARIEKKLLSDRSMIPLAVVIAALWAAGVMIELNGHLPAKGVVQTPVEVADKQARTGGKGAASYTLFLKLRPDAPAGPMAVQKSMYDRTPIGGRLCVIRTTGALGMKWWRVDDCRKSPGGPARL